MDEQRIVADDAQLQQLLAAVKKRDPSWYASDALLRLIQILAIVVGGGWVVFQYLTFEGKQHGIALEQQKIALQQQTIAVEPAMMVVLAARSRGSG